MKAIYKDVFDVIQYTGENKKEIEVFTGQVLESSDYNNLNGLPISNGRCFTFLQNGFYLIKDSEGWFHASSPKEFEKRYKLI